MLILVGSPWVALADPAPIPGPPDEIDTLLAKREHNFSKLKRLHVESVVDTERPAIAGKPARKVQMRFGFTIKPHNRHDPDPAKRFDTEMDMAAPLQMHVRMTAGVFSYLTAGGEWIVRPVPGQAKEFLDGLSDRHAGDAKSIRQQFDVQRLKKRDNFWGTRVGLVFVPKGKSKLYSRREETVDVATGQPVIVEHYNEKGNRVWRLNVNNLGIHHGVAVADDVDTESVVAVGTIKQHTHNNLVEVETE